MSKSYQATIFFDTNEDDFEQGPLSNGSGTSWIETLTADTKEELKAKIAETCYCKWEEIEQEDLNEYPDATEYWADYLANENNEGEATDQEKELWRQGRLKLWNVSCHITARELTARKVVL